MPSIGRIAVFETEPRNALRLETGVRTGDSVSPFYDSMIAKLIAARKDRKAALAALATGLADLVVAGPRTNARFLRNLLIDADVVAGRMDTGLIARKLDDLADSTVHAGAVSRGVERLLQGAQSAISSDPWSRGDAFQLGGTRSVAFPVLVAGTERQVTAAWDGVHDGKADVAIALPLWDGLVQAPATGRIAVCDDGAGRILVLDDLVQIEMSWPEHDASGEGDSHGGDAIRAPINGKVAKVFVREGQAVAKGERIAVVEAMKMEHVLHVGRDGTVARLAVKEGQQVNQGALVAKLAKEGGKS
jgi:3-methylcrotonyl-CoA carboxylase alpha subunit